ncbi:MAG: lysyl-tRNA synthetase class 2 [Bacteriovoracaceae bacterium]|jgi:lysyl-tRNA synthetase class 2
MGKLTYQFELIQAIRNFFMAEGFLDVLTPPAVQNPGMETHIHPFQLFHKNQNKLSDLYLHTSPEFHMKELLTSEEDFNKIFTISYCFRDEPTSPIHRPQFLMLEWYRKNERYEKIMEDTESLIRHCQNFFESKNILKNKISSYQQITVQDLFQEFLNINILDFLDTDELKNKIEKDFKDVPLPVSKCSWDDYYFLLFLNKIEDRLKNFPYLLIKEFPSPLSALSTISQDDPRVCERFEVYLSGVELCNCFNELTSSKEQRRRFELQAQEKKDIYNYDLPWPNDFMEIMNKGLPNSSGIALGVERLLTSLVDLENPFYK